MGERADDMDVDHARHPGDGGEGVALLTFNGRKTGKTYTIPVSYHQEDDTVTVITKRVRNWWRNFQTPLEVQLRLAGHDFHGWAEVETGESDVLEFMTDYLKKRPVDAKAYGLAHDEITSEKVARILPHIVLIHITITPTDLCFSDRKRTNGPMPTRSQLLPFLVLTDAESLG